MKYSFLVNKDDKTVMHKTYIKSEMMGSYLYENCKIFDKKNWDCSSTSNLFVIYSQRIKMIDGVFSESSTHREYDTFVDRSKDEKGTCAK